MSKYSTAFAKYAACYASVKTASYRQKLAVFQEKLAALPGARAQAQALRRRLIAAQPQLAMRGKLPGLAEMEQQYAAFGRMSDPGAQLAARKAYAAQFGQAHTPIPKGMPKAEAATLAQSRLRTSPTTGASAGATPDATPGTPKPWGLGHGLAIGAGVTGLGTLGYAASQPPPYRDTTGGLTY